MGNDDDNDFSLFMIWCLGYTEVMALYNCCIFLFLDTLQIGMV